MMTITRDHVASNIARLTVVPTLALVLVFLLANLPQASLAQDQDEGWWAVVTQDRVPLRGARSKAFYEIGMVDQGEIVKVWDVNEAGWARISPPHGFTGFANAADFEISEDGMTAVAPARTNGFYPQNDDPVQSWKKFIIQPDTEVEVTGRVTTPQMEFLRIVIPDAVPCAMIARYLRSATDDEVSAWLERVEQSEEEKAQLPVKDVPETSKTEVDSRDEQAAPEPKELGSDSASDRDSTQTEAENTAKESATPPAKSPDNSARGADEQGPSESDADASDQEASREAEQDNAINEPGQPSAQPDLSELELLYERLKTEPILQAEIRPVLVGFQKIADDNSKPGSVRRLAKARVAVLEIRLEHQDSRRRLASTLASAEADVQRAVQQNDEMKQLGAGRRVLSGELVPSSIYNGRHLPLRYRLRDPITGRTIVYVLPHESIEIRGYLGQEVRAVGELALDASLNVEVLELTFIEIDPVTGNGMDS